MSNQRKRPRPHQAKDNATSFPPHGTHEETHDSPLDACVQGYEATLTYDQEAFAKSLRLPEDRGGQLMRWIGSREAETDLDGNSVDGGVERQRDVWIDRYDILHLLPSLPNRSHRAVSPASSTGWTDMPSDAEDTFFLSGDEGDEYEREKKRRRIDAARERRVEALKTRMAEEEEARKRVEQPADDVWGDDDEEPPEAIKTLMRHTYKSLAASPNPQVLELRILTHHSGDTRFSFLKGRYRAAWDAIKSGKDIPTRSTQATATSRVPLAASVATKVGIGGLMGDYGDSDSEGEGSEEKENEEDGVFVPPLPESDAPPAAPDSQPEQTDEAINQTSALPLPEDPQLPTAGGPDAPTTPLEEDEEEVKARAIRREKARAWMAARKKEATERKTDQG